MFRRTLTCLSKRLVVPQLSPTHTACRLVTLEVSNLQKVEAYDPIMVVECSSDLVTEAYRETPTETLRMMIDTQDEGVVKFTNEDFKNKQWCPVGTPVGIIEEEEEPEIDGDWTWQAYLND